MANPDNVRVFERVELPEPPEESKSAAFAASAIALGLKVLSQRMIIGLRAAFSLLSAAAIFWVWTETPDPKPSQIISMTIFAVAMLVANVIVRRV